MVMKHLHIDRLMQERRNSSALAMELHLSCINPSIYDSSSNKYFQFLKFYWSLNSSPYNTMFTWSSHVLISQGAAGTGIYKKYCMDWGDWRFIHSWVSFWYLFSELWNNQGNKHQNNTWMSTQTIHHNSEYITLFLVGHNEPINSDKGYDFHKFPAYHTHLLCLCSDDYITIDCIMQYGIW